MYLKYNKLQKEIDQWLKSTFLVPSVAVSIFFKDNALNSAFLLNTFLKSLFKPTFKINKN